MALIPVVRSQTQFTTASQRQTKNEKLSQGQVLEPTTGLVHTRMYVLFMEVLEFL